MKQPPRHSPTPWIIERNGVNAPVIKTSLGYIAVCERARQEADARLIAAAPDLLRVGKLAQSLIEAIYKEYPEALPFYCKDAVHALDIASERAIARAEGRD